MLDAATLALLTTFSTQAKHLSYNDAVFDTRVLIRKYDAGLT